MHSYWKNLVWDRYTSFFAYFYQSYGPWFTPEFRFRSISWEQIDRISPNFIYAFLLNRSSFGLLHIIFAHFYQSYGPWYTPEFRFSWISWEQIDRISPYFKNAFILTRSSLGLRQIISRTFLHFFIYARILLPLNIWKFTELPTFI